MGEDRSGSDVTDPSDSGPVRAAKIFGAIVAPATMLTAIMFYFGLLHAYWFFDAFGVDYTIFEFRVEDYLIRSADGLFVPLIAIAAILLTGLWAHHLMPINFLQRRARSWALAGSVAAAATAAVLLTIAGVGIMVPDSIQIFTAVPGLSLTAGVALLFAASKLDRWRRALDSNSETGSRSTTSSAVVMEWAAIFIIASAGLFWAAGDLSAAVGSQRAAQLVANLSSWPGAVLYSEKSLSLAVPGVIETTCKNPEAAHRFRYDGLKMILHSGGNYFFLHDGWRFDDGVALVVPASDALRLEFVNATSRPVAC
ncbi:hypothetical protein [uncultured Arthrobacter sp.]|uniref:hypothetical protein n=1 Tax=uncultured Arthrobacter sp. TaxID=114050 RepID=UPI0025D9E518|nr:hypothetical protein [uncultured Arthrobacter sp.]